MTSRRAITKPASGAERPIRRRLRADRNRPSRPAASQRRGRVSVPGGPQATRVHHERDAERDSESSRLRRFWKPRRKFSRDRSSQGARSPRASVFPPNDRVCGRMRFHRSAGAMQTSAPTSLGLNGQPFSALFAACGEDAATVLRAHTFHETMDALATAVVGLESAFHVLLCSRIGRGGRPPALDLRVYLRTGLSVNRHRSSFCEPFSRSPHL